jgi:hypothetical protein
MGYANHMKARHSDVYYEHKTMLNPLVALKSISDLVEHPSHYTFGRYEVIDVLEDWFPDDPLRWQVGKYLARAGRKGDMVQDLEKAKFYLERRIAKAKEAK